MGVLRSTSSWASAFSRGSLLLGSLADGSPGLPGESVRFLQMGVRGRVSDDLSGDRLGSHPHGAGTRGYYKPPTCVCRPPSSIQGSAVKNVGHDSLSCLRTDTPPALGFFHARPAPSVHGRCKRVASGRG